MPNDPSCNIIAKEERRNHCLGVTTSTRKFQPIWLIPLGTYAQWQKCLAVSRPDIRGSDCSAMVRCGGAEHPTPSRAPILQHGLVKNIPNALTYKSGPPGVGKTLTAEAVSEHLKRPLYSISAGELPTEAGPLEKQLTRIFQITCHWDAILLLDEADVFLEQRSSHDVHRNSLVSVFLRKLEYCEGIMFLTTNRVSHFDEAILSRIHVMLKYDNLSKEAGKKIWKQFIAKAHTPQGPARVSEVELGYLVNCKLNGRQIKNIVAAAHALVRKENSPLLYSHLQRAVDANKEFISEFNGGVEVQRVYN